MAYQEKLVAFIDLLGFKELNADVEQKSTIHNVLKTNEELIKIIETINIGQKQNENCSIRIFSDSIFFSYPQEMFTALLKDIRTIYYQVAKQGYFFRGGITFGKVFDTGISLYGPAVIEAYELESNTAFYPRIILKKDLFKKLNLTESQKTDISSNRLILKDFDNQLFLNYLYKTDLNFFYELDIIRNRIISSTTKNKHKVKLLPKYLWLVNNFNCQLNYLKEKFHKEYYAELHNTSTISIEFKQKNINTF